MAKVLEFLSGKKTYIMAGLAAIDVIGAALGWWASDSLRGTLEEIFAIVFIRMGVTKSGPTV